GRIRRSSHPSDLARAGGDEGALHAQIHCNLARRPCIRHSWPRTCRICDSEGCVSCASTTSTSSDCLRGSTPYIVADVAPPIPKHLSHFYGYDGPFWPLFRPFQWPPLPASRPRAQVHPQLRPLPQRVSTASCSDRALTRSSS